MLTNHIFSKIEADMSARYDQSILRESVVKTVSGCYITLILNNIRLSSCFKLNKLKRVTSCTFVEIGLILKSLFCYINSNNEMQIITFVD